MLPPNTDPDIRRYDNMDDFHPCPKCGAWLLSLGEYEISPTSETPTLEFNWFEYVIWGWWAVFYGYIYDWLAYGSRQRHLASLKSDILPQFPHSLICPGCLNVEKKR